MLPTRPALLIALALPAAVVAEPLPLAHGDYVMRATPCADAPFAAMRSYDGVGLGDPHSHGCRARVMRRAGNRYVVASSCIGVGVGPGKRTVERLTVVAEGRSAFAILANGSATRYRLCPAVRNPPPRF